MSEVVLQRFCQHCGVYREPHEIRMAGPERAAVAVCAACGGALASEKQRVTAPLSTELLRSFTYPFIPAIALSIVGAALVSGFVRYVPLIGGLLSATIVVAFVFLVLRASAEGRDDLAIDTEVAGSLALWLAPLIRYFLTLLVAFSGAAVALFSLGWPAGAPVVLALGLVGVLYLPAGMIVAAHNEGCLAPLNPVPGVQIIFRIPGAYFLTLAFLLLTLLVSGLAVYVAALAMGSIPIVGGLVLRLLGLYGPVVMARQLGVLLREHAEEL